MKKKEIPPNKSIYSTINKAILGDIFGGKEVKDLDTLDVTKDQTFQKAAQQIKNNFRISLN